MNFPLDMALLIIHDGIFDGGNHVVRVIKVRLRGANEHSILI